MLKRILFFAKKQQQHYNEQCAIAKDNVTDDKPTVMHYSFDYAQQVQYPFNAQPRITLQMTNL